MGYGYGRNDPDNWDTDPWGRPTDPDDWEPNMRARQEPLPPPKKVPPMNLYGVQVGCIDDYGHTIGGDSGTGKCFRCGFTWQRLHTMLDHCVVGTGAIVLEVGQARTTLAKSNRIGKGT